MTAEPTEDFVPWPAAQAAAYRARGIWSGLTLTQALEAQVKGGGQRTALLSGVRRLSYDDLWASIDRMTLGLAEDGLQSGQYAIIQLPNDVEFFVVFFALMRLGVVPVLALPRHRRRELDQYASQTGAVAYFGPSRHEGFDHEAMMREMARARPELANFYFVDASGPREGLRKVLLKTPSVAACVPETVDASRPALLQLSGGSTGVPKLIPRTHDDYLYSIRRSNEICRVDSNTRQLAVLPLTHNFALSSPGVLGVLFAGGCVVVAPSPAARPAFALMAEEKVTTVALVPALARLWLTHLSARPAGAELAALSCVQIGGATLDVETAERVESAFGCQLQQVYGMAEGLVCYTRHDDDDDIRIGCQGRPMSDEDEVRIVDSDGHPVAVGEIGELTTRGPYTIRGYFRAPDHNRRAFTVDGFYRSGDLARMREDGNLVVCGRIKDQINRAGEKISAPEVEAVMRAHPDVRDVAVVALPDRFLGERSCAVVVLEDCATATPSVLRSYAGRVGMADYKIPDRIAFRAELPMSAVGKVDKLALVREMTSTL